MDLNQLADLGEFIGGVAVIVSLLFVGIQVRANARSVRNAAQDSTNDAAVSFLRSIYEDDDVCRLFWNGMRGTNQLDEAEILRFRTIAVALWLHLEVYFNQWKRGDLDEPTWAPLRERILWYFTRPGMKETLDVGLPLSADFSRFLETESRDFEPDTYDDLLHAGVDK